MSAQRLTPYSTRPPPPATQKFVTCEWLSINRGSTTLVGIPGKLYHRGDRVQCIIDSMYGLVYQQQLRSLSALHRPPEEADPGVLAAPHEHNPLAVCKQCGTTDRNDLQLSTDGDAMVCNRCGVVSSGIFKSLHRDRNCTEDEDKTVRAERPPLVSRLPCIIFSRSIRQRPPEMPKRMAAPPWSSDMPSYFIASRQQSRSVVMLSTSTRP